MKQDWKPGTLIYPLPAVLVSCGSDESEYNILTVAWTGTICTNESDVPIRRCVTFLFVPNVILILL